MDENQQGPAETVEQSRLRIPNGLRSYAKMAAQYKSLRQDSDQPVLMNETADEVERLRDRLARLEADVRALADKLESEAYEDVSEAYAVRNLHRKYMKGDCHAGGLQDAVDEIRALVDREE